MLKQIIFWLFSFLGTTAYASNIIDISQEEITRSDNQSFLLVDVRSPKEFSEGHVPHAVNMPLAQIKATPDMLKNETDKTIVLYCRSGYRAQKAANILLESGYTNLRHLEGDMLAWEKSGLPVEK